MSLPALPSWLEKMFPAGMRRRMVDVGGAEMHVAEWGQGPTVVMLHGNPSWGFLWRKVVAELLQDGMRLVVPDLVGLGLSSKPRDLAAHTLAAHRAWVARCLDVVAPGEVYFVGQDWGGPIGVLALAERFDRVRGVTLLNTMTGPPRPGFKSTRFHRLSQMPVVSDVVLRFLGGAQAGMALAQGDKLGLLGRPALGYWWPLRHLRDRVAPLAMARMVPDSLTHPSVPLLEACQAVMAGYDGPVSLVWGMRDPVLGGALSRMQKMLPRAVVHRTEAGHFLQEEVPGPIAQVVRDMVSARVN